MKLSFPEVEVMKSLYKNLLKAWDVSPNPEEEIRVIDNNDVIARRLEWLAENEMIGQPATHQDGIQTMDGAQAADGMDDSEAALLLGEVPDNASEAGFVPGLAAQTVEVYEGPDPEELLAQAREEAEQMIADAKAQVDGLRQSALEDGRQQGYAAGLQEAQAQMEEAHEQIRQKAEELERAYWNKVDELEPAFVDTLTGIYEHVFRVKLSTERQFIMNLLTEAMHGIEGSREFIVHVSGEDVQTVREAKQALLEAAVSPDAKVDIIEDDTLSANECLIETSSGIFDCSLDTQLEELKKQLKLLSYEK